MNILVVDDVPNIHEIITAILKHAGFRVTAAEDGEMAWDALCADQFDLMITDHDMPRLTGTDLIRRVRAVPFDLPVILMSGCIPYEEADLAELLQPGMTMVKPFSFTDLLGNVRSVLADRAHARPRDEELVLNGVDKNQSLTPNENAWQDGAPPHSPIKRLIGTN